MGGTSLSSLAFLDDEQSTRTSSSSSHKNGIGMASQSRIVARLGAPITRVLDAIGVSGVLNPESHKLRPDVDGVLTCSHDE